MKVIEPGHIYELGHIGVDPAVPGKDVTRLTFVNREEHPHEGTQTQEVTRVLIDMIDTLIDRTNHCDACLRWEGNDRIVKAFSEAQRQLRLAIIYHEQRVFERKLEKGTLLPEKKSLGQDGHWS